jgi:hypothetical protein
MGRKGRWHDILCKGNGLWPSVQSSGGSLLLHDDPKESLKPRICLQCYCHTQEGFGHTSQAGEQATSSFIERPSKRTVAGRCL